MNKLFCKQYVVKDNTSWKDHWPCSKGGFAKIVSLFFDDSTNTSTLMANVTCEVSNAMPESMLDTTNSLVDFNKRSLTKKGTE